MYPTRQVQGGGSTFSGAASTAGRQTSIKLMGQGSAQDLGTEGGNEGEMVRVRVRETAAMSFLWYYESDGRAADRKKAGK